MAYGKNGATCWLAGAVRTLQKRVEWLEARAREGAAPAPVVEHILQAPAGYTAHALVMEFVSPEPSVFAAPAPVEEHISPGPAVYAAKAPVVEYIVPAFAPAPVVEYISPDPAEYVAPAREMKYITSETAASYAPLAPNVFPASARVVENISPAPAEYLSPDRAEYVAPAPVVEYIDLAPATSYAMPVPTVFAAPAYVVENMSPAPEASYAAPASIVEYIAPATAGYAGLAHDKEKYFISMTRLEEEITLPGPSSWDGDGPARGLCFGLDGRSCYRRRYERSGDALWRVCQLEPAPRLRRRSLSLEGRGERNEKAPEQGPGGPRT